MGRKLIAGYILAGGANKRMQGKKKALLCLQGKPLWKWNLEVLEEVKKIYISIRRKEDYTINGRVCFENYQLIEDIFENKGPLGGIYSGLSCCDEEALLVLPCDISGCTKQHIQELLDIYFEFRTPVFYYCETGILPFPGVYTKKMLPLIEQMLLSENYRMRDLISSREISIQYILKQGIREKIKNINTMKEYEDLLNDYN